MQEADVLDTTTSQEEVKALLGTDPEAMELEEPAQTIEPCKIISPVAPDLHLA